MEIQTAISSQENTDGKSQDLSYVKFFRSARACEKKDCKVRYACLRLTLKMKSKIEICPYQTNLS